MTDYYGYLNGYNFIPSITSVAIATIASDKLKRSMVKIVNPIKVRKDNRYRASCFVLGSKFYFIVITYK